MKSLTKTIFPRRDQPAEARGGFYARSDTGAKPRSAQVQNISKYPVVLILLRIDELQRQNKVGHHVKKHAEQSRAELEACLAAIHKGAN